MAPMLWKTILNRQVEILAISADERTVIRHVSLYMFLISSLLYTSKIYRNQPYYLPSSKKSFVNVINLSNGNQVELPESVADKLTNMYKTADKFYCEQ